MIVEAYVEGTEYSLEYISWKGQHHFLAMTRKYTTEAPNYIERAHMEPADVDTATREAAKQVVSKALNSLGIMYGASHSEIKIDKNGSINIIEIGARMGGDCIGSSMVEWTTGFDFVQGVLDVAMGIEPEVHIEDRGCAAVRFVFDEKDLKVLEKIKTNHPEILAETHIGAMDSHAVVDSGTRHGYYLMRSSDAASLKQYMPESYQGKRILLLGAHALMIHVIEKAREMGIYTIVTDYVAGAPAKAYADEAYDVSTLDVDALVQLAKDRQVDAVFTGYVDINLAPCRQVCERLGMPFYATLEQLDATMNKIHFKESCRRYGITVVDDIEPELLQGDFSRIDYPVIVKPADSYSSKGISVCKRPEEMAPAISHALAHSRCHQYLVEKYLEADDVYLYFTVQDGYVSLSAMADRLLNDEQYGCAPQPVGYFFPSRYLDMYLEKIHPKVQAMMAGLGIRNGSFFMQGFADGEDIIFFEMGLRLSGGAGYLQIEDQWGVSQVEMHLRYALTGRFDGWCLKTDEDPHFRTPACVLVILLKDGTIGRIEGLDQILAHERIFHVLQIKKEGDVMDGHGTLNQVFARIYCRSTDTADLKETIAYIRKTLKIKDTENQNMIMNLFDEQEVL